jgi:hypothetical protein
MASHGEDGKADLRQYPVAIIEDRYGGCYSGGGWLAVAEADRMFADRTRASWVLSEGPHGDDCDAMEFWADPPPWIATGPTPDAALKALRAALQSTKEA